jgi:predicted RNase H-like HicB family nuclease
MRTLRYLVCISRDPDSDWGASVPDLPGCVATGRTLDSALRRIAGAIELHLTGLRADGIRPPRPSHGSIQPRSAGGRVNFYATVDVVVEATQRRAGAGVVRETTGRHRPVTPS